MRYLLILLSLVLSQTLFAVENFPAPGRKDARVYVPDQYDKSKAWPAIVLLHGYLGNDSVIDSYFNYSAQVNKRGFILIVPNGKADSGGFQYWNATDACCDFDHAGGDDAGYIKSLLKEVSARYNLDSKRIFVAGHSNGGFMSHRLACDPGSPFAAIVSLAGVTYLDPAKCNPSHPISILHIHALNDETVKYDGDPVGFQHMAPYPGAAATMGQWAAKNHCATAPVAGPVLQIVRGIDTQTQIWQGCVAGTRVEHWQIQSGVPVFGTGHIPSINDDFTQKTLDFLLGPAAGK